MGEPVPVGAGLQTHGDHVVGEVGHHGVAVGIAEVGVVDRAHHMDRVDAGRDRPDLHAVVLEVDRQRDSLTGLDEPRRVGHCLVGYQVERAQAVIVAPAPPVADLVGDLVKVSGERHVTERRRDGPEVNNPVPGRLSRRAVRLL